MTHTINYGPYDEDNYIQFCGQCPHFNRATGECSRSVPESDGYGSNKVQEGSWSCDWASCVSSYDELFE